MKIREILSTKGHDVVTIGPERSVLDTVQALVKHNIGGLVVTQGERPVGIITERDILRLTADAQGHLHTITVESVMTRSLLTATPDDDLQAIMGVMTEKKVRHLPVLEDGRLVGIVSIGDLLNACRVHAEEENQQLRQYIHG